MMELADLWKTSNIVPVPANISARLLKTKTGFQVRGIPVDVTEALEAEKRQEITVEFNAFGTISSISSVLALTRSFSQSG